MRKFGKHIVLLFLIIVVLMGALDFGYTYVYGHSRPRNQFRYLLQLQPQAIDYVFLGSSRTSDHIVTSRVIRETGKKAINLGIKGAVLEDNLLELKLLLDRKVKMQKVFLQVDYIFEKDGVSNIASSDAIPFLHNPVIKAHFEGKLAHFNQMYYLPFYRYLVTDYKIGARELAFSLAGKKPSVALNDGYAPRFGTEGLEQFELPETIRAKNATLEQIQQLCRENHVELVLFCAPFCSKTVNRDYIAKLKQKLPGFHDYSSALPDTYFHNCGHLNDDGAQKFTQMLIEDCIKNTKPLPKPQI